MQLKIRISPADPGNQAEILYDQSVDVVVIQKINQRLGVVQLVFENQRVDGDIDLHFVLMTIAHSLTQLLLVEIAGIGPRAEACRSQIDRVRPVVDGGDQRVHTARRC